MTQPQPASGLIDFIFHPPLNLLRRDTEFPTHIPNPISLTVALIPHTSDPIPRYAFGFRWSVNTSPTGAGRIVGAVSQFEQNWFSFALHYTLGDGSNFTADQVATGLTEGFWLWAIALPSVLTVHVMPGWTAHLDWFVGR